MPKSRERIFGLTPGLEFVRASTQLMVTYGLIYGPSTKSAFRPVASDKRRATLSAAPECRLRLIFFENGHFRCWPV
jgi:hypothetical protein